MISYSQNFEDVMLWRALKNVKNGFYVDVGAGRPELDSVTKHFYEQGWHGINIEPHSDDFSLLAAARPRDVNLKIAIGPQKGVMTFYENKIRGWSTLDRGTATEMLGLGGDSVEVQVECLPLQEVLDQYSDGPIHFLKIDVEGYEEEVLKSLDLKKSRPWIVVLEAADIHARLPDPSKSFLQLVKNGYELVYTDALNFFYISQEKSEELKPHFQKPPNIFDGFVHFNSRDQQQHAQYQDLRNIVAEGRASEGALKAEILALRQHYKELGAGMETARHEFAKTRKATQALDQKLQESLNQGLKSGQELKNELKAQQEAVQTSIGGLKEELAQQRKAQQEEVEKSVGGLKEELAQQRKAQQEAVKTSIGGLKEELAQQRKAQQEAVKTSVGEVKKVIVAEIHSLIANLVEQGEKNRLEVSARIESVEGHMEGRIVEVAKYATKIQEAVVSPSSYLIPAPFSWYSYLYKMLNIRKLSWVNNEKQSALESKRAGFWRRLERSIRKRRKILAAAWNFDPVWYLEAYPEVSKAGAEPLLHYINFGKQEGRHKNKSCEGIGTGLIRMLKTLRKDSLTTAPRIILQKVESVFWVVTLKQAGRPLEGLLKISARNRYDELKFGEEFNNKKDHKILVKLPLGIQKITISFEDKFKIQKTVVTKITKVSNAKKSQPEKLVTQNYDGFVDLSKKRARASVWRQLEARFRNNRGKILPKLLIRTRQPGLSESGDYSAVALTLNRQADKIFKEISRSDR
jgi:FkbM family methyltransferase